MLLHKIDALTLMAHFRQHCIKHTQAIYACDYYVFVLLCQHEEVALQDLETYVPKGCPVQQSTLSGKAKRLEDWFQLVESFIRPIRVTKSGDQRTFTTTVNLKHYRLTEQGRALAKASLRGPSATNDGICPKKFIEACLSTWRNAPIMQHMLLLLLYRLPGGFNLDMLRGNWVEAQEGHRVSLEVPLESKAVNTALMSLRQFGLIEKHFKETHSVHKLSYLSDKSRAVMLAALYKPEHFDYQPIINSTCTTAMTVSYPITLEEIDLLLAVERFKILTPDGYQCILIDFAMLLYLLAHPMASTSQLMAFLGRPKPSMGVIKRLIRYKLVTTVRNDRGFSDNHYVLTENALALFIKARKTTPKPYFAIDTLACIQRLLECPSIFGRSKILCIPIFIYLFYTQPTTIAAMNAFFSEPLTLDKLYPTIQNMQKGNALTVDKPMLGTAFIDRNIAITPAVADCIQQSININKSNALPMVLSQ